MPLLPSQPVPQQSGPNQYVLADNPSGPNLPRIDGMSAQATNITPDVARAHNALATKQINYTIDLDYYYGSQPLRYSSARLAKAFERGGDRLIGNYFQQNWIAAVVDARMDRISLKGVTVRDAGLNDDIAAILTATEANLIVGEAALDAHVCGEGFIIVWPEGAEIDEAGRIVNGEATLYHNDPRMVQVWYNPERPREKLWAAKWWDDEATQKRRMTIYYPDRIEYWVSTSRITENLTANNYEKFQEDARNPFGVVPVFHLRYSRRQGHSAITDAIPVQDTVNKLVADMMVGAEFHALPQRYAITSQNLDDVRVAPNTIIRLEPGDATTNPPQLGSFPSTDLGNFINAIQMCVDAMSSITKTPRHYFMREGTAPSGEALNTMEAPLNKKVKRFTDANTSEIRAMVAFLAQLNGKIVKVNDITPVWDKPETMQPLTTAQTRRANIDAGMAVEMAFSEEGRSPEWIAKNTEMKDAEAKKEQEAFAAQLQAKQQSFDQNDDDKE